MQYEFARDVMVKLQLLLACTWTDVTIHSCCLQAYVHMSTKSSCKLQVRVWATRWWSYCPHAVAVDMRCRSDDGMAMYHRSLLSQTPLGGYNIRDLVRGAHRPKQRQQQQQQQQPQQQQMQHVRATAAQNKGRQQQHKHQGRGRAQLREDEEEEEEEDGVVWNRRKHRANNAGGGRRKVAVLSLSGEGTESESEGQGASRGGAVRCPTGNGEEEHGWEEEEEQELEPPGLTLRPTPESTGGISAGEEGPEDDDEFEEDLGAVRRRGRDRTERGGRKVGKAHAREQPEHQQQWQPAGREVVDLVSDNSEGGDNCGDAGSESGSDCHEDECAVCGQEGELLMCDSCPRVFHLECVGLQRIPNGDWFCDQCR